MTFRLMRCSAAVVLRRTGCAAARMTSTRCGRMTTAWVTARTPPAPSGMTTARVTGRMRCRCVGVWGSTTGTTAMGLIVSDVGTAATRTTVRGSRTARAAVVHRPRVMRYRTTMWPTRRASVGAARRPTVRTTLRATTRTIESMGRHYSTPGEFAGARSRRHAGMSMVERRTQLSVARRGIHMVSLHGSGLEVMVMLRRHLMRRRARSQTTGPAVEGDVVVHVDYCAVVYVRHMHRAEVHDRAVVEECSAVPITARESNTGITEAVVHSAIEADMRAPVAGVPGIDTASPTPISRGPEQARLRR